MNVDPRAARDVKEWVEYSMGPLSNLVGPVPVLHTNVDWVNWAYNLIQLPAIQKFTPPDPRYFTNWQEWAFRFNQVVPL